MAWQRYSGDIVGADGIEEAGDEEAAVHLAAIIRFSAPPFI